MIKVGMKTMEGNRNSGKTNYIIILYLFCFS